MGLFSLMPKKSSSAGNDGGSHHGSGRLTRLEFKNLHRDIRDHFGSRGENLVSILQGHMDSDRQGRGLHAMTDREFDDALRNLRNNHRDNFSSADIDKLEQLVRPRL